MKLKTERLPAVTGPLFEQGTIGALTLGAAGFKSMCRVREIIDALVDELENAVDDLLAAQSDADNHS